jgi:hypothetical protein
MTIDNTKEYILCAAIRRIEPKNCSPYWEGTNDICNIEIGYRHHDILQRFAADNFENQQLSLKMEDQGFYTSKGRFVDRYEGMRIAYESGQVSEDIAFKHNKEEYNKLYSEDIY